MMSALRSHWPFYLIEAGGLAAFMVSACLFGVLLEHPDSPVRAAVVDPLIRRAMMGSAMGLTAIAIIYSPWGKRSGAHINPSVTLAFLRLGRIKPPDAFFYVIAQFGGGIAGVMIAWGLLGSKLAQHPPGFVVTAPGVNGAAVAFAAEAGISALLMFAVLATTSSRFARYTGLCAGTLVFLFIVFEAPLSGMSMNPARTLGSALAAGDATGLWIYFIAPPLGMLTAATLCGPLSWISGCARLNHAPDLHCIFCQE
jgi:aquaporin Z